MTTIGAPLSPAESKRCRVCGETKPLEEFEICSGSPTRRGACKRCQNAAGNKRKREMPTDKIRRARLARNRRKLGANKVKDEARRAVREALKRGELTRQPCEVCG